MSFKYWNLHMMQSLLILASGFLSCGLSRSISEGNLTLDSNAVSEVSDILEVLYEIDEEIGDDDVDSPTSVTDATDSVGRVYFGSDLLFGMPAAAAVIASVVLLVCCFCCLRCAIGYDGIKRQSFYGTKRRGGVKPAQRY